MDASLLPAPPKACTADYMSCDDTCCGVYAQLEGLFLARDNRTSQVAVIRVQDEADAFPGSTVLTTGDITFGLDGGFKALIGWCLDDARAWEVSYFGIFDASGSAVATGDNDLAIPGDLGLASLDFFAADQMVLDYETALHNAEVNYVWKCCSLDLLGGFRYVSLDEDFNINATDADTGTSDYNVRTSNDLYGGQIGARLSGCLNCLGWELTGKAGLFGNAASQTQFVTDFPPEFFLREQIATSGCAVSFVGDLNLSGIYSLNQVWSLRGGYNLLWIEGVALAPDQLDFTDTPDSGAELRTGNGLFLHGVNVGLEACW